MLYACGLPPYSLPILWEVYSLWDIQARLKSIRRVLFIILLYSRGLWYLLMAIIEILNIVKTILVDLLNACKLNMFNILERVWCFWGYAKSVGKKLAKTNDYSNTERSEEMVSAIYNNIKRCSINGHLRRRIGRGSIEDLSSIDPLNRGTSSLSGRLMTCGLTPIGLRACRSYSTSNNDKFHLLLQDKRELELKLVPQAMELLKAKTWPTTDENFAEKLEYYFQLSTYLMATQTISTFINKDKFDAPTLGVINDKSKGAKSPINRNLLRDKILWGPILKEAESNMASILYKIKAVNLLFNTNGVTTPGIDDVKVKHVLTQTDKPEKALKILENRIKYLKIEISLAKGKTDQAINRKTLEGLNKYELKRRYYKSTEGKIKINNYRNELKNILSNPIQYIKEFNNEVIKNNNAIRWSLLNELKNLKLERYKSQPILRVLIPKDNGKLRPLGIPTLRDRTIQMLMKIVMESYLEPLGDPNSYGFRPGRNCYQAITALNNLLVHRHSNINDEGNLKLTKRNASVKSKSDLDNYNLVNGTWTRETKKPVMFYSTKFILDADIKGCFDNIDHNWLINNVPMPERFKNLLPAILKTQIVERQDKLIKVLVQPLENNKGVPQGGIISPLLMNWTLDGLENIAVESSWIINSKGKTSYRWCDPDKLQFYESNNIPYTYANLESRLNEKVKVIRYADDFIVIAINEESMGNIIQGIKTFLNERGLILSPDKTVKIKWSFGKKFDFLGWTFHLLLPNKVNWIIQADKSKAGKLIDWQGLYIYPSVKSTSKFRAAIKEITSLKNNGKSFEWVIKEANKLIVGWSNYFSPGPKQTHIRHHLDWYIFNKMKMFLRKKYNKSFINYFSKYFQNSDGSLRGNISIISNQKIDKMNNSNLYKKSDVKRMKQLTVAKLEALHTDSNLGIFNPSNELRYNSILVHPRPYIERFILINRIKKDLKSTLLVDQKYTCTICNKNAINWNKLIHWEPLNYHVNSHFEKYENMEEINLSTSSHLDISDFKLSRSKPQSTVWDKDLVLDHSIPLVFGGQDTTLKMILNQKDNLNLVHTECHKIKTKADLKIISDYRKFKKHNLNKPITLISNRERQLLDYNCLLYITNLDNFKNMYTSKSNLKIINKLINYSKSRLNNLK